MSKELPFDPMPLFSGTFRQTMFGALPTIQRGPRSHTKFVYLLDKDYLALEVTTPKGWKKDGLTVVMIHGLCGSHKSPCLVRLAKKLQRLNVRSVRINLRGCGSGKGKAKRMYHAGQSEDVFEALKAILYDTPDTKLILLGFSLGGNISLKLTAELNLANLNILKKTIAINPPVDIKASIKLLAAPQNRIYERYFVKLLKQDMQYRNKIFSDFKMIDFSKNFHFEDYNRLYTVPEYGFESLNHFYKKASSKFLISAIKTECNILFSEDDPIIKLQDFQNFVMPKNVHLYKTKKGGHIGYVAFPSRQNGMFWIDNVILDWIFEK